MFSYKGYTLVFANSGKFAALLDMDGSCLPQVGLP